MCIMHNHELILELLGKVACILMGTQKDQRPTCHDFDKYQLEKFRAYYKPMFFQFFKTRKSQYWREIRQHLNI